MINQKELVTIIVPVYNVEDYLPNCLKSISQQTYTNFECILIDDGSNDKSGKICDEVAEIDKRFKVVHKKNSGVADARNIGIDIAQGEYICFVDSDDIINSLLLEKCMPYFEDNQVDMVMFGNLWIENEKDIIHKKEMKSLNFEKISSEVAICRSYDMNPMKAFDYNVLWNKIYRKKIFEKDVRFTSGKLFEDTLIIHHLYNNCELIAVTGEIYYYYRLRQGSILKSPFNINKLDIIDGYKDRLNLICKSYPEYLKKIAFRKYIVCIMSCYNDALVAKQSKDILKLIYKKFIKEYGNYNIELNFKDKLSMKIFRVNPKLFSLLLQLRRNMKR